jgi:hypothetical protein
MLAQKKARSSNCENNMTKSRRIVERILMVSLAIGLVVWSIVHIRQGIPLVIFLIAHASVLVSSIIVGYLARQWGMALLLLLMVFILAYMIIGTALYGIVLEGPHYSFIGSVSLVLIAGGYLGRSLAQKRHKKSIR